MRWLYDAHEYVQGVEWSSPAQGTAYRALEREFIRRADSVGLPFPQQIAELLRGSYRLSKLPLVVGNAPVREIDSTAGSVTSLRRVCGLAAEVPLLVYAGWIAPERGLDAIVEALRSLPGVHLAIVAGRTNPALTKLLDLAARLGVRNGFTSRPTSRNMRCRLTSPRPTWASFRSYASPTMRCRCPPNSPSICTPGSPSSSAT